MSARLFAAIPRRLPVLCRCSSSAGSASGGGDKPGKEPKKPTEQPKSTGASAESKAPPPQPTEPFDNSKYQAQELFQYNTMSFYDIECAMSPSRCPVPSSLKKPS